MIQALLAKWGLGAAFGFLKRNWKAALIVGLALVFLSTCARLNHAKADLTKARSDLKEARAQLRDPKTGQQWQTLAENRQASFLSCDGALQRQSAAVLALKAEGDRLTAAAEKATGQARKAQAAADRAATSLLNYKAQGPDACARTADAIRRAREDVQ